jgi:hypothetical protein
LKLQISSWNNGANDWNAEAEETSFLKYKLRHRFNHPAEAIVTIADTNGTKAQKYNVDANDVYLGPAKATIEHPDATDIFYGRILRAEADSSPGSRNVTLYCRDWMDQLDEERITYDMREDLDGSGLRQSALHADADAHVGLTKPYLVDAAIKTLYSAKADDGGVVTTETAAANEDTADDMTLLPAVPAVGDYYYFGFETAVEAMTLYLSQQGDWVGTTTWRFWDGAAWNAADLSKTDPLDDKWTFEQAVGEEVYEWEITGGATWTKVAVDGVTAYWLRCEVTTYVGITTQPLGQRCWAEYYVYDDDMTWDTTPGNAQNFDGMRLAFTTKMAGTRTWEFFPYDETYTGTPTTADDIDEVWIDDANTDRFFDNADFTTIYHFRCHLGHNTPSDFYVHDSITGGRMNIRYQVAYTGSGNHVHLGIYDNNAAAYHIIHSLEEDTHWHRDSVTIPFDLLTYIVDSSGIAKLEFDCDRLGGSVDVFVYYCSIELDTVTTGYSTLVTINETEANRLRVATDMTAAATRVWEGLDYCILKPIYKHLDTAESVGKSLITDEAGEKSFSGPDPLVALTAAATIEHTSGYSAMQFKGKTRLKMLQALAPHDKAVFWMDLGTVIVNWKSTWNDGAPTAMTDASVENWRSVFDYETVVNEFDIYGARIGDGEIYENATDATSIAKFRGTRTKIVRDAGLVSFADAAAKGAAMAAKDANPQQMLYATLAGLDSTYRLGTEVSITSTYLGLTAAKYIVYEWAYDSETHQTNIVLHPRVSQQGLMETREIRDTFERMSNEVNKSRSEQHVADPVTHEVS